jgi:UDP-N-acetylglucosamine 1-carboxyvinyltransferase
LDNIVVTGGAKLRGEVRVAGAKNAALPLFASSLLATGRSTYRNVPALGDVRTMQRLLRGLGAEVGGRGPVAHVDTRGVNRFVAPYELVETMRASVLLLGPLLARHGQAEIALPGGCAIGPRPIDQHLKGLELLGARLSLHHGMLRARGGCAGPRSRSTCPR